MNKSLVFVLVLLMGFMSANAHAQVKEVLIYRGWHEDSRGYIGARFVLTTKDQKILLVLRGVNEIEEHPILPTGPIRGLLPVPDGYEESDDSSQDLPIMFGSSKYFDSNGGITVTRDGPNPLETDEVVVFTKKIMDKPSSLYPDGERPAFTIKNEGWPGFPGEVATNGKLIFVLYDSGLLIFEIYKDQDGCVLIQDIPAPAGVWGEEINWKKTLSSNAGHSVMGADGDSLAILDSSNEKVYLYHRDNDGKYQLKVTFRPPKRNYFGNDVAVSEGLTGIHVLVKSTGYFGYTLDPKTFEVISAKNLGVLGRRWAKGLALSKDFAIVQTSFFHTETWDKIAELPYPANDDMADADILQLDANTVLVGIGVPKEADPNEDTDWNNGAVHVYEIKLARVYPAVKGNGVVTVEGSDAVVPGGKCQITVKANDGYVLKNLFIDGGKIKKAKGKGGYSLSRTINKDTKVKAIFREVKKKDPNPITFKAKYVDGPNEKEVWVANFGDLVKWRIVGTEKWLKQDQSIFLTPGVYRAEFESLKTFWLGNVNFKTQKLVVRKRTGSEVNIKLIRSNLASFPISSRFWKKNSP